MAQLNSDELIGRMSRRDLLKSALFSAGVATIAGTAAYKGLRYLGDTLIDIMTAAEQEIRALTLDLKAWYGTVDRKLAAETRELREYYTSGRLKVLETYGIAEPAEISEFETLIKQSEEFEKHYTFAVRTKELKDRIDKRLLSLDEKLEGQQTDTVKDLNDSIRKWLHQKPGEEGKNYRKAAKERLEALCAIYDSNEDNKTAEVEVLKKLNDYVSKVQDAPPEERELYIFLKEEYEKEGNKGQLKEFIKNYDKFDGKNDVLLTLRAYLSESENLYGQIKENKQYLSKLQGLLRDGIALKEDVKNKSAQDFKAHEEQITGKVSELRTAVDTVINELKNKGYDIETREDYVKKGTYGLALAGIMNPIVRWGTALVAGYAGIRTLLATGKNRKTRATKKALEDVVEKHNALDKQHAELKEKHEKLVAENKEVENLLEGTVENMERYKSAQDSGEPC